MIANDHAVVDIWNYKDDYLQTVQLKELKNDLKKSCCCNADGKTGTFQKY
jgi:hypothetical protein